jgi:hypothetical protein
MDRTLIDRYADQADCLHKSIAGLSRDALHSFPVPGTWSIQQIICHVLDSDLVGTERMKRVIAEDRPRLLAYDETAFAANLHYDKLDAATVADLFDKNRRLTATLLRNLPDAAFLRIGVHSEKGELTLARLVDVYVDHVEHHLEFVRRKRELLGAPAAV